MIQSFFGKLLKETLFLIALGLVILFSFFIRLPDVHAIDYGVIGFLAVLMLISLGLEKERFLDTIATAVIDRCHSERTIGLAMMGTTLLMAMFVTNDVALITVVPITLIISKKGGFDSAKIIILETAAANFGGSLTPMGNPQNIFLYHFFKLSPFPFIGAILPFFAVCAVVSGFILWRLSGAKITFVREEVTLGDRRKTVLYLALLMLALLTVFRIVSVEITFAVTVIALLIADFRLFYRVDYFLLGTFVLFFLIIRQISSFEAVKTIAAQFADTKLKTFLTAAVFSQGISNVPSAILIAPFTDKAYALVLGVSAGGFGTLIASLANLISYKYYVNSYTAPPQKKGYLVAFHRVNFLYLGVLVLVFGVWYGSRG